MRYDVMLVGEGDVVWVGCGREWKRKGKPKTCFLVGQEVYVHYFKDIRQGSLQVRMLREGILLVIIMFCITVCDSHSYSSLFSTLFILHYCLL